jgi:hypothetical protein
MREQLNEKFGLLEEVLGTKRFRQWLLLLQWRLGDEEGRVTLSREVDTADTVLSIPFE